MRCYHFSIRLNQSSYIAIGLECGDRKWNTLAFWKKNNFTNVKMFFFQKVRIITFVSDHQLSLTMVRSWVRIWVTLSNKFVRLLNKFKRNVLMNEITCYQIDDLRFYQLFHVCLKEYIHICYIFIYANVVFLATSLGCIFYIDDPCITSN